MKTYILSVACAIILWPICGFAELYKWVDDEGNFHITDTPPPWLQKKSSAGVKQAPRTASPKKARVRPLLPGQHQAEVRPIPEPVMPSSSDREVPVQQTLEGLSSRQATLTSSWQIFDSDHRYAKAPVQWWKDQQGLDHFADVLPVLKGSMEDRKIEDVSVSPSSRRGKEQGTGVSRLQHRATE